MVDRVGTNTQFQQDVSQSQGRAGSAEGQYRGRSVSQKVDISSMVADAAEEMSFAASEKLEKKLAKRKLGAQGGKKSTAMEQAENYLQKMPDLGDKKKLQQFCEQLKKMADQSPQQLRQEAGKFFKDVSHQFAALSFAREMLGEEGGNQGLRGKLGTVIDQLAREHGPSVKAGVNISATAARYADAGLGDIQHLRDFYRETVLEYDGLNGTYRHILDNMNYFICPECKHTTKKKLVEKCPVCGTSAGEFVYNEEEFISTVTFLIKSVGSDLESKGPSLDAPELKKIIDDLYLVETLGNLHRNCSGVLGKMKNEFGVAGSTYPPELIENILSGIEMSWLQSDHVTGLVEKMAIIDQGARIYFVREFKELVRMMPLKIFADQEKRENLITVIQEALDHEIEKEEG